MPLRSLDDDPLRKVDDRTHDVHSNRPEFSLPPRTSTRTQPVDCPSRHAQRSVTAQTFSARSVTLPKSRRGAQCYRLSQVSVLWQLGAQGVRLEHPCCRCRRRRWDPESRRPLLFDEAGGGSSGQLSCIVNSTARIAARIASKHRSTGPYENFLLVELAMRTSWQPKLASCLCRASSAPDIQNMDQGTADGPVTVTLPRAKRQRTLLTLPEMAAALYSMLTSSSAPRQTCCSVVSEPCSPQSDCCRRA